MKMTTVIAAYDERDNIVPLLEREGYLDRDR